MDINKFPFRLDERTHAFLSGLIAISSQSGCKLQSMVHGTAVILFDKELGPGIDCNVAFTPDAIKLQYTLKSISKDKAVSNWLNQYHSGLQKQKNATLVPVINRCFVEVHASYDGRLQYFLTYMVAYPDESIAQDTPQGKLYFQSGLQLSRGRASQSPVSIESAEAPW